MKNYQTLMLLLFAVSCLISTAEQFENLFLLSTSPCHFKMSSNITTCSQYRARVIHMCVCACVIHSWIMDVECIVVWCM